MTAALYSTKELKALGRRPRRTELPAKIETWNAVGARGTRHLWRLDQTAPLVTLVTRVAVPRVLDHTAENVLRAAWTVNRAAKRKRDVAESCFHSTVHGLTGHHKREKERYYGLKDSGVAWLALAGALVPDHRYAGLVVWCGGGYRFHSTLAPASLLELPNAGGGVFRDEAQPAMQADMRLIDAAALLERLAPDMSGFTRLPRPQIARVPQMAGDWKEDDE